MFHLTPSKAVQVSVLCGLTCISVFSICGGGGVTGLGIAPKNWSIFNVFKAAPFSWTTAPRGRLQLTQLKAPPAYVNTGAVMEQPSQSIPSSAWTPPPMVPPTKRLVAGGTTGSAPSMTTPRPGTAWPACTRVDVWESESIRNTEQTPTINDPNASITLDIKPPLEGVAGGTAFQAE
jgi:hypothetical protein